MNNKLVEGIDDLAKKVKDVNESIESICTVTLCLIENQCMQIRADEQDDIDKKNIALMGIKTKNNRGKTDILNYKQIFRPNDGQDTVSTQRNNVNFEMEFQNSKLKDEKIIHNEILLTERYDMTQYEK